MSKFNGFSLLEVLIATSIFSIVMLGIAGICLRSFKRSENLYWYTLASSQLISMRELCLVDDRSLQDDCKVLLPDGECLSQDNLIKVCWKKVNDKECLSLEKNYVE